MFLSWYGTDMTLSCPVSLAPPSVICKKQAMELTVVGEGTADELSVACRYCFSAMWTLALMVLLNTHARVLIAEIGHLNVFTQ